MLKPYRYLTTVLVFLSGAVLTTGLLGVQQGKVCGSTWVSNWVKGLTQLEDCRVIEGNLTIVLIDEGYWGDYDGSFPLLVEITGVLLFYRVSGLKSLNQLFPNLAVIGGEKLFEGYALIVYEMLDLENIGLSSLTLIRNGAVRIEKNPQLCHVDTVDWSIITTGVSPSENFFKKNGECANTCPSNCEPTDGIPRCWGALSCQKIIACPSDCSTGVCNGDTCCHPNCVGGCSGPSANQCTACKDVIQTIDEGDESCVQQCSPGFYMYHNRRCLTADECLNFNDYEVVDESCAAPGTSCMRLVTMLDDPAVQVCSVGCPNGYETDRNNRTHCVPCEGGKCTKVCFGKVIDSLNAAESLGDCRVINGSLHFKLKECANEEKLEHALSQVTEVTGYIAVSNSYGLHSLGFMKGLRKVGGNDLIHGKYAFHIFNNMNLQELIPEQSNDIEVVKGTILFQNNGKLDYKKISNFVSRTNIDIQDMEASSATNGHKLSSSIQHLQLTLKKTTAHISFIEWSAMSVSESQVLLEYSLFWKETSGTSVTVSDEADGCTEHGWYSSDIDCIYSRNVCNKDHLLTYIAHLKPWTRYAAYVRALTTTTESAVSNVVYFTTDVDTPSLPVLVQVRATEPDTLHLTWEPPSKPNGIVNNYKIRWTDMSDNVWEYQQRNYCAEPFQEAEDLSNKKCCPCSQKSQQQTIDDMLAERNSNLNTIFQNMLQNRVYVKRKPMKRNLRSTGISGDNTDNFADVYNTTEFIVNNLESFKKYRFEVQACHSGDQGQYMMCSEKALAWGRTLPNNQSDAVDASTVSIDDSEVEDGILLNWDDPPHPNGIILTYEIEIVSTDSDRPVLICLQHNSAESNYYIMEANYMPPGGIKFRIRATSLAGAGPWTEYIHYTVPQPITYECYRWTQADYYFMDSFRTPMVERQRCEDDLGYVYTQGNNENYPGCNGCWCCKPLA